MRHLRYVIASALLVGAVSCEDRIGTVSKDPIEFRAGIETKAFMNSEDLNDADTELTIWGFEDGTAFIPGEKAGYDAAEGKWVIPGSDTYYWENDKAYTFFSYLSKDKDGNAISASGANPDIDVSKINPVTPGSTGSLTVNARTFDFNASTDNAFDFCYSDVVSRPATPKDHSSVNLSLNHLYTAVTFSALNYTDYAITLKEVTLVGLKNRKSATLSLSGSGPDISYDDQECTWTDGSRKLNSADITIASNGVCANLVGDGTSSAQYFMFWSQTSEELAAEGWTDSRTEPTGGAYVKVVYVQDGAEYTRYAKFPEDTDGGDGIGWPEGTKRLMTLAFRDKMLTFSIQASPWNYSESEMDYNESFELATGGELSFDTSSCTVDEVNHKVYFKSATHITGSFKIAKPVNATWVISKDGDFDAFELDNAATGICGDGTDTPSGVIDGTSESSFTLYPLVSDTGSEHCIQLSFSIRYPNGEFVCVDDKIQPVKWTFILTN